MKNFKQNVYPVEFDPQLHIKKGDGITDDDIKSIVNGMTKLEYTAIEAMKSVISDPNQPETGFVLHFLGLPKDTKYDYAVHYPLYISKLSINYAKALLTELQNTEK